MSEHCLNPTCGSKFTPYGHGHPQKFCSRGGKIDTWMLRKAAEMLSPLPPETKLEILAALSPGQENHCKTTVANQNETNGRKKTYQCQRWPYLSIGKLVKFQNGYFVAEDPELQGVIESNESYKVHIFPVDGKPEG